MDHDKSDSDRFEELQWRVKGLQKQIDDIKLNGMLLINRDVSRLFDQIVELRQEVEDAKNRT